MRAAWSKGDGPDPSITARWTITQFLAWLGEEKTRHGRKSLLASPALAMGYAQARDRWHRERDPWGNSPLTLDDWADGRHLRES